MPINDEKQTAGYIGHHKPRNIAAIFYLMKLYFMRMEKYKNRRRKNNAAGWTNINAKSI